MEHIEVVWTIDSSSGRVHKRYRVENGQLATLEGCQADQSGDFRVVTADEVKGLPAGKFCANDFPDISGRKA